MHWRSLRKLCDGLGELETKMQDASETMEFEKAIEYRELLTSVKQIAQKQKITNSGW